MNQILSDPKLPTATKHAPVLENISRHNIFFQEMPLDLISENVNFVSFFGHI